MENSYLHPKKDYFGWFYHKRSRSNKWLLQVYTLGFLIFPIFYGVFKSPLLEEAIFTEVGLLFLFFLVFYCYGFSIHNFPKENSKALRLNLSLLIPLIFLFFTAGSHSVSQSILLDGSIFLTTIALVTAWHILSHIDHLGKLKNDFRIYAFLGLLILASLNSMYQAFSLFIQSGDHFTVALRIGSFVIALISTIIIHQRYIHMLQPIRMWTTSNKEETMEIGKLLAKEAKAGDIFLLYGEMGAGKTTLVKGIAKELGIESEITSPTFTLMNVYTLTNTGLPFEQVAHVDTYRLQDEKALLDIGVQDYFGTPDTLSIIEWPEKVEGLLAGKKVTKIYLEHVNEQTRKIVVENG